MHDTHPDPSLENEISTLLNDLSLTQNELLAVLSEKRRKMAENDVSGMKAAEQREAELAARLEECHNRRAAILKAAKEGGRPGESLGQLTKSLGPAVSQRLGANVNAAASRMRLLQHDCLTNWVLAQRSLLHISQILEIIATGGRITPTYNNGNGSPVSGGLVDSEA